MRCTPSTLYRRNLPLKRRFRLALHEALREGRVRRVSRNVIAPAER